MKYLKIIDWFIYFIGIITLSVFIHEFIHWLNCGGEFYLLQFNPKDFSLGFTICANEHEILYEEAIASLADILILFTGGILKVKYDR